MKKILVALFLLVWMGAGTSCSSSTFEKDVRKAAKYQCEKQKLLAADPSDDKAQKKLADLEKEIEAFSAKMEEKHKSKRGDKEWEAKGNKIMDEEMAKCK